MEQRILGRSGLSVSRLCFGSLTVGPAQADLSPDAAAEIISHALRQGVNFIDTAEIYENYEHIRLALKYTADQPVITTKTYAYTWQQAEQSLENARRSLDLDVIDIFLLHEQESCLTLDGHREAFSWLLKQKEKGLIKAVGISTHAVEPVRALAAARTGQTDSIWQKMNLDPGPYREADVIHPLINVRGIGLIDGTAADMTVACRQAKDAGLGLYGMKMLGGGHLLGQFDEAVRYVLQCDFLDAVSVGMQSTAEVDMNIALFENKFVHPQLMKQTRQRQRKLIIEHWCTGCGKCTERCGEHALSLVGGKAVVDREHCIFCGYCGMVCRDFAIKIY